MCSVWLKLNAHGLKFFFLSKCKTESEWLKKSNIFTLFMHDWLLTENVCNGTYGYFAWFCMLQSQLQFWLMPINNKRIIIIKYCLYFHVLTLVIHSDGWADVSCVRMAKMYFYISKPNNGHISKLCRNLLGGLVMHEAQLAQKWRICSLCKPAAKLFGLMRNSWWCIFKLKWLDFAHEKSTCDHTFVAVCA